MAPVTLDQRHLQPVAGSAGAGERYFVRLLASERSEWPAPAPGTDSCSTGDTLWRSVTPTAVLAPAHVGQRWVWLLVRPRHLPGTPGVTLRMTLNRSDSGDSEHESGP